MSSVNQAPNNKQQKLTLTLPCWASDTAQKSLEPVWSLHFAENAFLNIQNCEHPSFFEICQL